VNVSTHNGSTLDRARAVIISRQRSTGLTPDVITELITEIGPL